ncbi:DUF4328 domain-containing protein [Candidatus Poriferisodalis sp.]|uniref:DUF4328 domain-containing protein n=1 Tax=Candidatus Poriferisodalis sp. TaxID=3101277 RepID=UPI003B0119F5
MTSPRSDPSDAASNENRRLSRGLTKWLVGLLAFYAAVVLVKTVTVAMAYLRFDESTTEAELAKIAPEAEVVQLFESVYLPIFVLFVVWTLKAHRASGQLWPYDRRWRPAWAVGGYFVPILWFVIPPKVLAEIHRIADAERAGGRVTSSWTERRTPPLLVTWWIAFAYASVAGGIAATVIETSYIVPRSDRITTVQSAYGWSISANLVAAASAVMAAVFVSRLGRRLQNMAVD